MKIFFKTRSKARTFTANNNHTVQDASTKLDSCFAPKGKRWYVDIKRNAK